MVAQPASPANTSSSSSSTVLPTRRCHSRPRCAVKVSEINNLHGRIGMSAGELAIDTQQVVVPAKVADGGLAGGLRSQASAGFYADRLGGLVDGWLTDRARMDGEAVSADGR